MRLTDWQVEAIRAATKKADDADKHWESVVATSQGDTSQETAKKRQQARENYYQEAATVHLLMREILKEADSFGK